jgi:hypothetical protein
LINYKKLQVASDFLVLFPPEPSLHISASGWRVKIPRLSAFPSPSDSALLSFLNRKSFLGLAMILWLDRRFSFPFH